MASAKKTAKNALPPTADKRLRPFIERGISNGIFQNDQPVVEMYHRKASDADLKETIDTLGGPGSDIAQQFITDIVLTDLTSILRQKRYLAHVQVWEVRHSTVGAASGNPRAVCNIFGQAVVEADGDEMEPALFSMSLWDGDASIGDDVEADGTYSLNVSCRNLDAVVLDFKPLSGLTAFSDDDYEHGDSVELLKDTYEIMQIADLEDDLSRGRSDYRLIEATVSYAGVQNSKAGNRFGKMLLKDDSTMTLDAIESGESLMLNALCSPEIASRFGRYSKILALITTKVQGEYGLSANIEVAIPVILVPPPQPTQATAVQEKEDDAASYFSSGATIDLDDDDDEEDEAIAETPAPAEPAPAPVEEAEEAEEDDDDDEDIDLNLLPVKALKAMAKAAGISPLPKTKADLVKALSDDDDDDSDDSGSDAPAEAEGEGEWVSGDDDEDEWGDWD